MSVPMEINYKIIFPDTFKISGFGHFLDPPLIQAVTRSHGMGFACFHAPGMVSGTSCQGIASLVRFSPDSSSSGQSTPAPRILLCLGVKL